MATSPVTTGAPTRAHLLRPELSRLEDIAGDLAIVPHVLDAASESESLRQAYLIEAASMVTRKVIADLSVLVADGLADRGEG